jgi:hypothetical protein
MTDLDTLAALAEAAQVDLIENIYADETDPLVAFWDACTPEAILALIARVRAAEAAGLVVERIAAILDDHLPLNPPGEGFYGACLCGEWNDSGDIRWADHSAAALRERLLEETSLQSSAANEGKP